MQIIINGESKTLYSTRDEAIYREITAALESGYDDDDLSIDEWVAANWDVAGIAEAVIAWTDGEDTGHQGIGYYCNVDDEEFWGIVEGHALDA